MIIQRLLYRSDSALTGSVPDIERTVAGIVETSHAANEAAGITGALMLSSGIFVQALEGPADRVEGTFERICADMRHRNVRLLELAAAEERVFSDWAMVQVTPTAQLARLCPTLGESSTRLDATTANATIQMMRTLLLTGTSRQSPRASAGAVG